MRYIYLLKSAKIRLLFLLWNILRKYFSIFLPLLYGRFRISDHVLVPFYCFLHSLLILLFLSFMYCIQIFFSTFAQIYMNDYDNETYPQYNYIT